MVTITTGNIIDTSAVDMACPVLAPNIGDTVYREDGSNGIITRIVWESVEGKLTDAEIHTDSFVCRLGEVAYFDAASPAEPKQLELLEA